MNPSGYAMPGNVGGSMHLTTYSNSLVIGFDSVSTSTSDVYVYVDSNDMVGSTTGYFDANVVNNYNLPYAADYVIKATSTGVSVHYWNSGSWVENVGSNAVSAEGAYLEIGVPISSLGGSQVNSMNIVATVQDTGTTVITESIPVQNTNGDLDSHTN